jgi:hypothetical protein
MSKSNASLTTAIADETRTRILLREGSARSQWQRLQIAMKQNRLNEIKQQGLLVHDTGITHGNQELPVLDATQDVDVAHQDGLRAAIRKFGANFARMSESNASLTTAIADETRTRTLLREASARSQWQRLQIAMKQNQLNKTKLHSLLVQAVFELELAQRKLQESYKENVTNVC